MQDVIRRQVDVIRQSLSWTHETVPGIAMVLDDTSVLETNGSGNYLNEAVMWEWKMGLARYGVPELVTGTLGVLGPLRMSYGRTISAVRFVAGVLSELVLDSYGE